MESLADETPSGRAFVRQTSDCETFSPNLLARVVASRDAVKLFLWLLVEAEEIRALCSYSNFGLAFAACFFFRFFYSFTMLGHAYLYNIT